MNGFLVRRTPSNDDCQKHLLAYAKREPWFPDIFGICRGFVPCSGGR